ncbi:MAG TPA: hypothetical protein VHP83_23045 [Aggregatilineaceae bacterium]|nr:hypothetical protein [Aggregatilineaceae bacterium]
MLIERSARVAFWVSVAIFVSFIFFLGSCCYACYYLTIGYEHRRQEAHNNFLSTPISGHIVQDLCTRKLIPPHVSNCTGNVTIERKDIKDIFEFNLKQTTTHEEVDKLFGKYEQFCEAQKGDSYRCYYQLGDPPTAEITYSSADESILQIVIP